MLESKDPNTTERVCLGFIGKMLKQVWATATPPTPSTWAVSLLCGATEELNEQLEVPPLPTLVERQPIINLAEYVLSYWSWLDDELQHELDTKNAELHAVEQRVAALEAKGKEPKQTILEALEGVCKQQELNEQLEVPPLPTLVERQPLINLADYVLSYSRWL
jgi:hypothetical protein